MRSRLCIFLLTSLIICLNSDLLKVQNVSIQEIVERVKNGLEKFHNIHNTDRQQGELLRLKNGVINGTIGYSKSGRQFMQFYGIPYAEPPIGQLRLKIPVPAKSWSGIKDASKPPPKCTQPGISGGGLDGQEDCLYLNVFVPKELYLNKNSNKTPVMVGIHGGAFLSGTSTEYTPDYIMERDVIFVTINYRLGVLGFFGMNDDQISGNFGLKDQSLALRWVKENIARFGGDPANITLIGESAGSVSVHLQMFSPLSKGLFQKAIMQSGSAFGRWGVMTENSLTDRNNEFLNKTGCLSKDSLKVLKCLQSKPKENLYSIALGLKTGSFSLMIEFAPIIESNVKLQPFLPQKPTEETYQTRVPWLTGINSGEGAMFVNKYLINGSSAAKIINSDKSRCIPQMNQYQHSAKPEDINNITRQVLDFYFGSEDIGLDTATELVDMITDSGFLQPLIKTVRSSREQQYVYMYDHRGSASSWFDANLTVDLGVGHASELSMLYRQKSSEATWTLQDKVVSSYLLKFWVNFAISADPNRHSVKKIWKPVQSESDDIEYLHIKSDSLVMEKNPYKERFDFWQSLPTGWN